MGVPEGFGGWYNLPLLRLASGLESAGLLKGRWSGLAKKHSWTIASLEKNLLQEAEMDTPQPSPVWRSRR